MLDLTDKRIVLTGAASGIGKALLARLSAHSCQILAIDRDEIPGIQGQAQVYTMNVDLTLPNSIEQVFARAQADMGSIDVFIANAGFAYYGLADSSDWDQIERIYRVNVFSPLVSLAKMRQMNPVKPYAVVITASAIARLPVPGYAHYSATKAALMAFESAYRYEKPGNEHLMVVYPIATRTAFFRNAHNQTPVLRPNQSAEWVAKRIYDGLVHRKTQVNPSTPYMIFSAVNRVLPILGRIYQLYGMVLLRRWTRRYSK